ncbi:hypothetical protein D3C83_236550 [compost metagenome]
MQAEFLLHLFEFRRFRVAQGDPHEAVGLDDVIADGLDGDIAELAAVLVGDAVD